MIDQLLQVLAASGEAPDAVELADALWLAERLPEHASHTNVAALRAATEATVAAPATALHVPVATHPTGVETTGNQQSLPDPHVSLRLRAQESVPAMGPVDGNMETVLVGVPTVPMITDAAAITRALRPLRLRLNSRVGGIVDEQATAQRIADTGIWLPELLPATQRRLDLMLVVDDSASTVIWRRTRAEFCLLLTHLAAFRDIRLVYLNTDREITFPAVTGPLDRRLTLVLSDCVGQAWTDGTMLRALERAGPVAIVQLLPQRLWTGCGLSFVPVWIDGDLETGWRVQNRDGGTSDSEGFPVPVLELSSRWLAPWAAALAGQAATPTASMAVFTRSAPVLVERQDPVQAYDRVALFRAIASPTAMRLAAYIAAAPLSVPLMRLVQHVMLPMSHPADLAEVFLSGLFRRITEPGRGTAEFEFYPGVRKLLLSTLRRAEVVRVLRLVSAYIGEQLGSAPQFAAVFTPGEGATGSAESASGERFTDPFAALALTMLRTSGGSYREIADKLAKTAGAPRTVSDSTGQAPVTTPDELPVPETASAWPPGLWRGVPPNNPDFIGREDLLLALRSQLDARVSTSVPIVLHGLSGTGKTQIAIQYLYRFAADYDLICWVSGEAPTQLQSELAAMAPDLNVTASGDLELTLSAVRDALRRGQPYNRWLLVVDNADAPAEVIPLMPQAGGHILITSRDQTWADYAQVFLVAEFSREESIGLIQRRGRHIGEDDADRLAECLGDFPIAIAQAAAWQAETGMSVQRYLALLDQGMSTLLAENPPAGYKLSVVAAWVLTFNDLQRQSPEGAALLQLCSFLGPEPIPYALLWSFRHAADLPSEIASLLSDSVHFHRAIREVSQRALLKVDHGGEALTEHRLVQAVLREQLSSERQAEMMALVWKLLIVANPGRPDNIRNWEMLATINSHLRPSRILDADDPAARRVVIDQIQFLYNCGDQVSSRELNAEAVHRWRVSPGPFDEHTLIACRLLGIVTRDLGQVDEARAMNESTLAQTRSAFGPSHEDTILMATSYACDLRIAGAYVTALELDETLLEQHKRIFGENDARTFRSAHNLAMDLCLNGQYEKAYVLDTDTLRRRREIQGEDHWETWISAAAVGKDLRELGDFASSARYLEEAISQCSALLGPRHPEVIRMKMDFAATLRRLGRFVEARELAEECLVINLWRLGGLNSYTLSIMATLAEVLRLLGEPDRALDLTDRVVAAASTAYGSDHPLVAICEHNYAIELRAAGENDHAYAVDRRANQQFHQTLGGRQGHTASSDMGLARDLELRGEAASALRLLRRAVETSAQVRGATHPNTLFCAANLARLLRNLGETAEADRILARTLPTLRDHLGTSHPEVTLVETGNFIEFEIEMPDA